MLGWEGRPSRMAGRFQEALLGVGRGLEALTEGRVRSGGPPKGPGGVGRPSRRAVWGWETLPQGRVGLEAFSKGRVRSRDSIVGPGGVGRLYRRARWGREALSGDRLWSGGPPRGPDVVRRPFWRAARGQDAIPVGRWV